MKWPTGGKGSASVWTGNSPVQCQMQYSVVSTHTMSDSDIYQILYRSFDCLVQQIVMPAIRGRSQRKLRSFQRPGCNSGNLADFGTTQTEGWRALAERYWCILEEQLYPAVISSRLSQQRGMYINSSR